MPNKSTPRVKAPEVTASKEPTEPRQQRRVATEARLIASVGELLNAKGVDALGVNAVAATAGVDKALVYRYFGDWNGLLRAYGKSAEFWPSLDEVLGADRAVLRQPTLGDVAGAIVVNHCRALRRRPATIALMRWECAHRNELTQVLEQARETWSNQLRDEVMAQWPSAHQLVAGLTVLLTAAVSYLAIRGAEVRIFGGLDLSSEQGWTAIEQLVTNALRCTDAALSSKSGE